MNQNTKVTKNKLEGVNFLLVNWVDTVSNLTLPKNKDIEIFTVLGTYYNERHRKYHNWEHIKAMIKRLYDYPDKVADRVAIELAIWFHDAIYVPLRQDNEVKSARLFHSHLSNYLENEKTRKIMGYIEATKRHAPTADQDLQLLLDLDLAILGQPKEVYQNYSKQIREEFSIIPDFIYKAGRKRVIKKFLEKPKIYQTDFFIEKYEEQARENIKTELERL